MESTDDWRHIVAGAGLTSGLLLFEHLTLWELRTRLPMIARYALGTFAIGAGVTFASPQARVFWPVAVAGGATVVAAHLARRLQAQPADKLEERLDGLRRRAALFN